MSILNDAYTDRLIAELAGGNAIIEVELAQQRADLRRHHAVLVQLRHSGVIDNDTFARRVNRTGELFVRLMAATAGDDAVHKVLGIGPNDRVPMLVDPRLMESADGG